MRVTVSSVQDLLVGETMQFASKTVIKKTNYLSETFLYSQTQTVYVHYLYQNVSHINEFLFFFLIRILPVAQRLDREVRIFPPAKDSYFCK